MKLPAFFGHKRSINLLPKDAFESSTLGVILDWSMVFGKWSVIVTQILVMSVFFYRLSLDRKLTDMKKSIATNVAVVKSYDQIERDYVIAQKQISQAKTALTSQKNILETISLLESTTPSDVWYDKINYSQGSLTLNAYAGSLSGFGQLLTNLSKIQKFSEVKLGKIESGTQKNVAMEFDVTILLGEKK